MRIVSVVFSVLLKLQVVFDDLKKKNCCLVKMVNEDFGDTVTTVRSSVMLQLREEMRDDKLQLILKCA